MRYAVISDIHGNLPALKAVLEDAAQQGAEHYLIAGDYCLSGAWPDECLSVIRAMPDAHIIRGNEEAYVENLVGKDQSLWTDGQMQISYWVYRNVSDSNREYMLALPHTADIMQGSVPIHMAHSSAAFIGPYELDVWGGTNIAKRYKGRKLDADILYGDMYSELDSDSTFQDAVSALDEGVYVFGHTHVQWHYKAKDKEVYLINPGSCGLPVDGLSGIPYTLLDISDDGQVNIEERRLPFDKQAYIGRLKHTTQYTEANVWTRIIIKELETAREHMMFFIPFANQYADSIGDAVRPFSVETWKRAYEKWSGERI